MLEDVVKAIENVTFKSGQFRYIDGRVFILDHALGKVAAYLRGFKRDLGDEESLSLVKHHISKMHYYLIENGSTLSGFLLDQCQINCDGLPRSNGQLISGYDCLPSGDRRVDKGTGIVLFDKGRYVAEFTNNNVKHLISVRAFDRFVRNYRQNEEISLRNCLFEMCKYIRKAVVQEDAAGHLKRKLGKLHTKDKDGKNKPLLRFERTWYLHYRGDPSWIFVRQGNEIVYCQPVYSRDRI